MKTIVTFKNMNSSKHYRRYVQDKLSRFDKLLDKPGTAEVVLRVEKLRHIVEINLTADRLNIHASDENEDMHAAVDLVLDKVRSQITRSKEKLQDRRTKQRNRSVPQFEPEQVEGTNSVMM